MTVRRGAIALVLLVAVTVASYAVYPDGQFARGAAALPTAAVAACVVVTVATAAALLWWLARTVGRSAPPFPRGTADTYLPLLGIAALCHVLGVGLEMALGAPALWLVLPIATLGYAGYLVWFQKRHGSPA